MPIREESFRIGCGRYLQRAGLLKECGGEIASLGKAPLIVGGKTALELTRETIEKSVRKRKINIPMNTPYRRRYRIIRAGRP